MVPWKNGPRKIGTQKNGTRKIGTQKIGTQKNGPRKIGTQKNGTRKIGTQKIGTQKNGPQKNRGVSVEHRGVCVRMYTDTTRMLEYVINLFKPKTRPQTFLDSFSVLQFGACIRIVRWTSKIFLYV